MHTIFLRLSKGKLASGPQNIMEIKKDVILTFAVV